MKYRIFYCPTILLEYNTTEKLDHNAQSLNSIKASLKEMSHDTAAAVVCIFVDFAQTLHYTTGVGKPQPQGEIQLAAWLCK